MPKPARIVVSILIVALVSVPLLARAELQDELGYHIIKTDQEGMIVPWFSSNPGQAYDHNIRLVWDFWKNMKSCPNGVKYYLQHRIWKKGEDGRGLGGDQLNMALSSWNLLHQYLGDSAVKDDMGTWINRRRRDALGCFHKSLNRNSHQQSCDHFKAPPRRRVIALTQMN